MSEELGAALPKDREWQIGKNAASIHFVESAERFLTTCDDSNEAEILRKAIRRIKSGELALIVWLSPQSYLESHSS